MKKILILFAFIAFAFGLSAQVTSESVLTSNQRYKEARMMEWDIVTPTNSVSKYFNWDMDFGVKYKININADSLFATAFLDTVNYAMFILKESTNGVNFTNLDTIKWYGITSDTTILFDRTGSITSTIVTAQELNLVDSTASFTQTTTSRQSDYNYTRFVGVEAKVDSTGGRFLWTDMDITIWVQ
jgi:hypothetical protein